MEGMEGGKTNERNSEYGIESLPDFHNSRQLRRTIRDPSVFAHPAVSHECSHCLHQFLVVLAQTRVQPSQDPIDDGDEAVRSVDETFDRRNCRGIQAAHLEIGVQRGEQRICQRDEPVTRVQILAEVDSERGDDGEGQVDDVLERAVT